jgi:hypothetical protein
MFRLFRYIIEEKRLHCFSLDIRMRFLFLSHSPRNFFSLKLMSTTFFVINAQVKQFKFFRTHCCQAGVSARIEFDCLLKDHNKDNFFLYINIEEVPTLFDLFKVKDNIELIGKPCRIVINKEHNGIFTKVEDIFHYIDQKSLRYCEDDQRVKILITPAILSAGVDKTEKSDQHTLGSNI